MCRKVVSVVMLLLVSWVFCWGEARPLATTQDSLEASEVSTMTPSELWQKADESLKIIEDSLIAQGEPVESLSKSLENLYQKSQELQESVNALSQRFESFEEYLTSLEKNMTQAIKTAKVSAIELIFWRVLAIVGIGSSIVGISLFWSKAY
jgi:peptidoglycan hydrolase CwlO-like protein